MEINEQLKNGLIVSCQALDDEPLHSSFIMGRMALAAKMAGAVGIRANTVNDIREIKKNIDLPVIGIIKKDFENSQVYITPTMKEIDDLVGVGAEIIATDATNSKRPKNEGIEDFYKEIREKYPNIKLMADCSTLEEAVRADKLGFDYIGTTLVGYTPQSKDDKIDADDFKILKEIIKSCDHPVIAEGNIDQPEKAKRVLELGALTVVVGGAITRPQNIAKKFVDCINSLNK